MAEFAPEVEHTVTEQRILDTKVPVWYSQQSPRVCLLQIRAARVNSKKVEARRQALEDAAAWDYEDYDEIHGAERPEGAHPKADVLICGIGGCTLRMFETEDGQKIEAGACKADGYCLAERFDAVGQTKTVQEGQALYNDIIDSCDGGMGSNFCPRLECDLIAGVSEDGIPGKDGVCAMKNAAQLEQAE